MAKRKYETYTLVTEFTNEQYESYSEVFHDYHKCKGEATMYGTDEQGEVSVIMSK